MIKPRFGKCRGVGHDLGADFAILLGREAVPKMLAETRDRFSLLLKKPFQKARESIQLAPERVKSYLRYAATLLPAPVFRKLL